MDFDNMRHLVVLKRGREFVYVLDPARLRHRRIEQAPFAERACPSADITPEQLATVIRSRRLRARRLGRRDGGKAALQALDLLAESTPTAITRAARHAEKETRARAAKFDRYFDRLCAEKIRFFVEQSCEIDILAFEPAKALWQAYRAWEKTRSTPDLVPRPAFVFALLRLGFRQGPGGRRMHGLRLRERPARGPPSHCEELVAAFVRACCREHKGWFESAADLYQAFIGWLADNGKPSEVTRTAFGLALGRLGYLNERSSRVRWHGIRLLQA